MIKNPGSAPSSLHGLGVWRRVASKRSALAGFALALPIVLLASSAPAQDKAPAPPASVAAGAEKTERPDGKLQRLLRGLVSDVESEAAYVGRNETAPSAEAGESVKKSLGGLMREYDGPAVFARKPSSPPSKPAPSEEPAVLERNLELIIGKAQLVRTPAAVSEIFIADPNIANVRQASKRSFYLYGNRIGRTNVIASDPDRNEVASIEVVVTSDTETPRERLADAHPGADVAFDPIGKGVKARGAIDDVAAAKDIAAMSEASGIPKDVALNDVVMDAAQQINIRVRFAEVARSDTFRFGINWQALVNSGDLAFGITSGSSFLSGVPAIATGEVFGSAEIGDVNLDLLIDGLQQEGLVNILAEPNLTALNGEAASFLAGGEIPIPIPQIDGNSIAIQFKPFGVSLDFLPTIMPGGRINLKVRPEVSELIGGSGIEYNGFAIPALSVRRTDTSVELASGQTLAIAGMFQRSLSNDVSKFPVLGDVPVLGQFFQSKGYRRNETELVILITPYLVTPTNKQRLAAPNQRPESLDASLHPTSEQAWRAAERRPAAERAFDMRALSPAARDEASVSRRVDQSEAASNPEPTNDAGFIVR